MVTKSLAIIVAAGALAAAAPAFAEEPKKEQEPSPRMACCERMERHMREHDARLDAVEKKDREAPAPQVPVVPDGPFTREESYGG